jgi:hypothetical protein
MNCFSPGIAAFLYALAGVCARRAYLVIMQQRKRGESHFFSSWCSTASRLVSFFQRFVTRHLSPPERLPLIPERHRWMGNCIIQMSRIIAGRFKSER